MKKLFLLIAVPTAIAMIFSSCKNTEAPEIEVTEVKVTPSPASVVAGETTQLTVEVLPKNATDKTVTWGSRDESVAKVDQNGLVTGVAVDEVEIWAKAGNKTGKVTVTVTAAPIRVKTITLNKTELSLFVGKTEKLTYTTDPANPTDPAAEWKSDKENVATVAEDGTVTAVGEGTATITLTVDEKTAVCEVTVSIAAIADISLPYLKDVHTTVAMTAEGFLAGDKINLEDFFGNTAAADVKNVTAAGAAFDFPSSLAKDRTYRLSVMRNGAKQAEAYIRYDDDMVKFAASLGYALTASNEVVEDGSVERIFGGVSRGGYVTPAAVFEYNEADWSFDASAADLKLCTFTPTGGTLNLNGVNGAKDLSGMKNFDLSGVTKLMAWDSRIEELDMTLFPNCTELLAWGDPGLGEGRFKKVNFGTPGVDAPSKLVHIQLERHEITGPVDISNLSADITKLTLQNNRITGKVDITRFTRLREFSISDNLVEELELGHADGIATDPDMLVVEYIEAANNQLKEIDISNCGRLRKLLLAGNKIERATLLNNATKTPAWSADPDSWFPYMYILKNKADFTIDWATEAEAAGRERHIRVEHYWYRNFSPSNKTENGSKESYDKWVTNNPVVRAYNVLGFKVTDYYYVKEGADGAIVKHVHEPGGTMCDAEQDAE